VARESEARRRDKLSAINRELEAMSDWELERGLASSLGFDHDQRNVANASLGNDMPDLSEVSLCGY
jgi:hypothetical protein